jgi:hypothetical protein
VDPAHSPLNGSVGCRIEFSKRKKNVAVTAIFLPSGISSILVDPLHNLIAVNRNALRNINGTVTTLVNTTPIQASRLDGWHTA